MSDQRSRGEGRHGPRWPPHAALGVREERCYLLSMQALRAHMVNGQIVLDEPTEIADGTALSVYLCNSEGDTLSDEEREALHGALDRSIAQADAGQLIDADEVLAELERP